MDQQQAVILFDGVCTLCNRSVQFILRHDSGRRFQFASLQSPAAERLLAQVGQRREALPDSVVLIENGRVYTKSTAALRIAGRLSGLCSLAYALIIIPPRVRNWGYDLIGRNRYRLFGKQESCMLPTPETRGRFLAE